MVADSKHNTIGVTDFMRGGYEKEIQIVIKESFSFKTRMPGMVKCRPTVAY